MTKSLQDTTKLKYAIYKKYICACTIAKKKEDLEEKVAKLSMELNQKN